MFEHCSNVSTFSMATTLSSREFNQNTSEAKRASHEGPVFITDRGHPAHVLLSIEEYIRITGHHEKIADLLAMRDKAELDISISKELARPADFY